MWLDKKNAQNKSQCVPSVPHVLERSNFIPFWCSLFGLFSGFFVMTCFIEGSCMEWLFSASEILIKLFSAQATILFISYARIHWSALYSLCSILVLVGFLLIHSSFLVVVVLYTPTLRRTWFISGNLVDNLLILSIWVLPGIFAFFPCS